MTFADELQIFAESAVVLAKDIKTEASTNISLVLPFLSMLGYDTRNPNEVCPEFGAGFVAAQESKRVDFAVLKDGKPIILVESKWVGKPISLEQGGAQLFHYFAACGAKFAVLTNGLVYRFYTDSKKANIMDDDFFLEINLESLDVKLADILEIFKRELFDEPTAKGKVVEYTSMRKMRKYISRQLATLDDDEFVRLIVKDTDIYNSHKNDMNLYRQLVKNALRDCITDFASVQFLKQDIDEVTVAENTKKERAIQSVISTIREMFVGTINAERVGSWETKNGTTIAYFEIVICKLFFYENGEPYKMIFLTDDGAYPRKVKCYKEINCTTDYTQFKDLFAAQIEQVKKWVKKAAL
jgi:hypothetical protein